MGICYWIFVTFLGRAAKIVLIFILIIWNCLQTDLKYGLTTWLKQLASDRAKGQTWRWTSTYPWVWGRQLQAASKPSLQVELPFQAQDRPRNQHCTQRLRWKRCCLTRSRAGWLVVSEIRQPFDQTCGRASNKCLWTIILHLYDLLAHSSETFPGKSGACAECPYFLELTPVFLARWLQQTGVLGPWFFPVLSQ